MFFLFGSSNLEGCGSRNNFDEFSGDDRLPGPVEGNGQLLDHLLCNEKNGNESAKCSKCICVG